MNNYLDNANCSMNTVYVEWIIGAWRYGGEAIYDSRVKRVCGCWNRRS